MEEFVKRNTNAPRGFFACEAAGLAWLGAVAGGVPCARVLHCDQTTLTLERLRSIPPDVRSARAFGRRLAVTHDAGAAGFGAPPHGWGGPGFFGPLTRPLPMSLTVRDSWGIFYAEERLIPMLEHAATWLDSTVTADVERVVRRCAEGDFDDDDDHPARLHGDLWSGNVMWTEVGAVLIDPAAHGGHRETDLAMLALFGCPHLHAVVEGYHGVHPLRDGWRDRLALHQLYPLLAHVALFGAGYVQQAAATARVAAAR